jgi:hypothetical protein
MRKIMKNICRDFKNDSKGIYQEAYVYVWAWGKDMTENSPRIILCNLEFIWDQNLLIWIKQNHGYISN